MPFPCVRYVFLLPSRPPISSPSLDVVFVDVPCVCGLGANRRRRRKQRSYVKKASGSGSSKDRCVISGDFPLIARGVAAGGQILFTPQCHNCSQLSCPQVFSCRSAAQSEAERGDTNLGQFSDYSRHHHLRRALKRRIVNATQALLRLGRNSTSLEYHRDHSFYCILYIDHVCYLR